MKWAKAPGNKLTQKDSVNSGLQFITLVVRGRVFLARDPDRVLDTHIVPKVYGPKLTYPNWLLDNPVRDTVRF